MTRGFQYLLITGICTVTLSCSVASATDQTSHYQAPGKAAGRVSFETTGPEPTPVPRHVDRVNDEPSKLVHSFYEFYLDGFPSMDDSGHVFANYLSGRFFRVASKADDYDPFLSAQDFDETWKDRFKVSPAKVTGNKARVRVDLNGETMKWALEVTVVKQGSGWRIDGVRTLSS